MSAKLTFISAGAGSGKTYRLTELLHDLLVEGKVTPAGVIATTFTTKAAAELRERVRAHLLRKGRHALATAIGQARIGTVNSVCGTLLTRFAFEAGLPPQQRVLDEERAKALLGESVDEVLSPEALAELLALARRLGLDYRPQAEEPPWRVAFGDIVNHARANAIDPEVLRGFGPKNADELLAHFPKVTRRDLDRELREAIEAGLPSLKQAIEVKSVKKTVEYVRLAEKTLADLAHGDLAWSQWAKLANAEAQAGERAVTQRIADVATLQASHPRLQSDVRDMVARLFALAADALTLYAERKRQMGAVDFTDQERLLLDVLDRPSVAGTLKAEIELLMVDEFQDTSPIQLALFLKIAALARQVVWVGDVKQAIYGFRGGDATLMQAVLAQWADMGGAKEVLGVSYRSRPALVEFVNALFGSRFPGLDADEVRLRADRKEYTGAAAIEDWVLEGNQPEQYQGLAAGIASLVNERVAIVDRETKQTRPVRLADIAVLARSNKAVKEIAAALVSAGIAAATSQPGLTKQPEVVLALACLRRLNDERDTIATAEIASLAGCEDPDEWLSDRLAWITAHKDPSAWRESGDGSGADVLAAIQGLRAQRPLLTPREAMEWTISECGVARHVLQWQCSTERARKRLANLDRLVRYATDYENDCRAGQRAATLSGFLLWMQERATDELDELPQPAVDAVRVLTHHSAKGLEWPVVVLVDLAGDIKDAVWDSVRPQSQSEFDARAPLKDRFLRYWPWPYGAMSKVPVADDVETSPMGIKVRAAAVEEHKRLLYVSLTRARDVVVLARPRKKLDGEWMQAVGLGRVLPGGDRNAIVLEGGTRVPYRQRALDPGSAALPKAADETLHWFAAERTRQAKLPLVVSPSTQAGSAVRVVRTDPIGQRIDTTGIEDRESLGEAVHACIAADLVAGAGGLSEAEVQRLLARMGFGETVPAAAMLGQLRAIRAWIDARWPGAERRVEVPVTRVLANGQRVAGRIDLLLGTAKGWILIDHKSTPQASGQWENVAAKYDGQLSAYRESVESVTKRPVEEMWLLLPVAGAGVRVECGGSGSK